MTGTVQRRLLTAWTDPAAAFASLYATDPYAFWLDTGPGAQTGVSYLGAASPHSRFVTASVAAGTVTSRTIETTDAAPPDVTQETIFDFLRRDLAAQAGENDDPTRQAGFELGWVGWLGYELGAQTVGTPVHGSRYPDAALLEVHRLLRFDHGDRTVTLVAGTSSAEPGSAEPLATVTAWFDQTDAALTAIHLQAEAEAEAEAAAAGGAATAAVGGAATAAEAGPGREGRPPASVPPLWRHDPATYAALIGTCLAAIHDGDAYQLCLTNEIRVPGSWHPVDTFVALRAGSPSHHGGLLRFGDVALLSASPEQFLYVGGDRRIRTKPIKGTRPRASEPDEDERLKLELAHSDKERAENLMIVDLMRNDIGRIAQLGTVAVSTLLAVESYPHVHQLVSTIEAQLAPGVTVVDAIETCFPAGSMTGAPKRSAMSILNGLERGPRGIYSGAFGYIGRGGVADLAIVIRSIVLDSHGASIGTGGGITALSDASEEIDETRIKAAALLASLGVAAP